MTEITNDNEMIAGNELQPEQETNIFKWLLEPKRFLGMLTISLIALALGLRMVFENLAFTVGLDFYEPEFQQTWMPILYAELAFVASIGAISTLYIWVTREKDASAITPKVELDRYFILLGTLAIIAVWAAPVAFLSIESDAAWHQVTIRDTDFTPSHITIFYFAIPLLTALLVATFAWAHTRLPMYMNRISIPFVIVITGIFMIMPNYGFNEWGHTFFYMEELFAAPIHYGFVLMGWAFFALVPLLVQMLDRMGTLIPIVAAENVKNG
ncbi:MAG: methane monooxygenase/ammonia monooxygenase subunit C [Nitrospinaceae bacterium]|nr:methane monooxygenase/ammonia monooxygenase subunit C [Gammaproteobacteria bacterium]HIL84381.1 methane monooxygenase/ammonia monooxygenase subunit C [Pseudomonadales bacterium]